ncbi:MAG: hypothetical protein IPK11_00010 [Ignavibacteria bacterium]|nr:hypothetical protein [Ignavibacteria bacterium]
MIQLNEHERAVAAHLKHLKDQAGTHSPSIFTLAEKIPDLHIRIDACFLSDPMLRIYFLII